MLGLPEYDQAVALLDDSENAVRPSPGKFEGCGDERIAKCLNKCSLEGDFEDSIGSPEGGGMWIGQIGRFVCWEDPQGFFSYESFDTEEAARLAFLGHS